MKTVYIIHSTELGVREVVSSLKKATDVVRKLNNELYDYYNNEPPKEEVYKYTKHHVS